MHPRSAALRRAIPERAKPLLRGVANAVDPLLLRLRRDPAASRELPSRPLRASVGQPSASAYLREGRQVATELGELLSGADHPLGEAEAICDLASGPGKVLDHLEAGPVAKLAAVDVNPAAIEWLRRNRPEVDARRTDPTPPCPFEDRSFDLLFSISLLTHLSEFDGLEWLREVGRLLSDDGVALITVHGEAAFDAFRSGRRGGISAAQLAALRRCRSLNEEGFAFVAEADPHQRVPGVGDSWGLAFHSPAHIRRSWGEVVDVREIVPAAINYSQDAVLIGPKAPGPAAPAS